MNRRVVALVAFVLLTAVPPAWAGSVLFVVDTTLRENAGFGVGVNLQEKFGSAMGSNFTLQDGIDWIQVTNIGDITGGTTFDIQAAPAASNSGRLVVDQEYGFTYTTPAGSPLFFSRGENRATISAYVLGGPGTPFSVRVVGDFTAVPGAVPDFHSTSAFSFPGVAFSEGSNNFTYELTDFSRSETITFGGQIYSLIRGPAQINDISSHVFGFSGPTSGFTYSAGTDYRLDVLVTNLGVVPEPSSAVLSSIGALLGLGCWWRHRRPVA